MNNVTTAGQAPASLQARSKQENKETLRVLVVEDDPLYADIVCRKLDYYHVINIQSSVSLTLADAFRRLDTSEFDIILLDLTLPDSRGIDTVRRMREHCSDIPLVVLTGFDDEDFAYEALQAGAEDYLIKAYDEKRIVQSLRYTIERFRTRTALAESRASLKEAQLRLIQAEKMESIGRLAAGIAHEVKNPLAIIQMGLDYLRRCSVAEQGEVLETIDDMDQSIDRAFGIIKGLLDFSVATELELNPENINETVRGIFPMIRHERNKKRITFVEEFSEGLPDLLLDRRKIQQVFINLVINAIDAMEEGGTLTIRSYSHKYDSPGGDVGKRTTDRFGVDDNIIIVEFQDTGTGIADASQNKVYDPFYTTKEPGKGTGLGLSISRNITELHGGALDIMNAEEGGAIARLRFIV